LDTSGHLALQAMSVQEGCQTSPVTILAGPTGGDADDGLSVAPVAATAVVADLDVAGRYIPAGRGPEPIAGDFWDVLELPGGRVGLVVGDVSGHGTQALARMRPLRATARAYALRDQGPAALIAALDAFMDRQGPDEMATLWFGEYDPASGRLRHASAGHPPPVVVVDGGSPVLLGVTDAPPLGTGVVHEQAREHADWLPPGAILVAYTDGLVERRKDDITEGLDLLAAVVATACAEADEADVIAQAVLDALVPDADKAEDDVCLLVVRRQPDLASAPQPPATAASAR
jgi:serine phosphatase RsbU (regulator of sigma subunit)